MPQHLGLLDPIIDVRESKNQIDDLINEIQIRVEKDERILVTTLTKRMAWWRIIVFNIFVRSHGK